MNVGQMKKALERARKTAANVKAKAEGAISTAVTSGETVGGAFLTAYARGRMGGADGRWLVGNVDADLLAGLGLHAIGFIVEDKYGEHAHAVGNGALACYSTMKGIEFGRESKKKTSGAVQHGALREHQPRVTESAFDQAYAR